MEDIVVFPGRWPRPPTPSIPVCSDAEHMPTATDSLHSTTQSDCNPQKSNMSLKPAETPPTYVAQTSLQKEDRPPKTDLIAAYITHMIDDFSLHTFKNFQDYHNKLHTYPARQAKSANDTDGAWIGYTRYTFDMYGHRPKNMRLRLERDTIWVRRSKVWITLEDYLSSLSPPANIWTEPKAFLSAEYKTQLWRDQWDWWRRNGKEFRLLDLPTEVREIIISFAVVCTVHPYPGARCRRLSSRYVTAFATRLPNTALLLANKQVHAEGTHILFRDSVFLMEHRRVFVGIMAKGSCRDRITKLELRFNAKGFLKLFGVTITDLRGKSKRWRPQEAASMLHGMNLKELTLSVPFPDMPIQSTFTSTENNICHKALVDLIIESAWPWIKGHPVTVYGGIKTSQKEEFLQKCVDERRRYLEWCEDTLLEPEEKTLEWYYGDGGARVDDKEIPIEDLELVKVVPPPCRCTLLCSQHWTPED